MSLFLERLKDARKSLGLSQAETADLVGVTREHWGRCERGEAVPGGEVLAALAIAGADVLYILTGEPSQPTNQLTPPAIDRIRLVAAIAAIEEGLAETRRKLTASKKAELVLAAYDLMAEPAQTSGNVIQLVRLAA